jgi:dissimilatory sulfite reductase (desulfoviridin) alpha/beta subunit
MAAIDDPKTFGRARLSFADQHDIDEFIAEEMYQRLAAVGLALPAAGTIADVTSCPGAESCKLAVTQSRGLGDLLGNFLPEQTRSGRGGSRPSDQDQRVP